MFIANVSANNNLSESSVLEEFDSSLRDNDVNFNNCGDDSSNINLDENSLNCNSSNLSGDSINYKNFSRKNLSVSSYEFGGDIDVSRYVLIGDDDVSLSNYASGKMGTHIVSNDFVQTWDDSKFFKACLSDDYNNSLVNKLVFMTISISNNSKTYNSTTDNEGYVCLQINLCTGEYSIDSSFEGDNQYSSSFKSNKIIVNKADTSLTSQDFTFNQEGNYFTAKLLDNYGNPIVNSTVNVGLRNAWGSKVYYKNTDENGIVKLQMNLNTGIYYIDYSFGGSTNYKSSFGTNTFNMVNNKLTSSVIIVNNTIKKGGYFSAILQDNNRLAMSNQSIDFVLSIGSYSKTYYLITNSNGESSLQINLAPNNWRMDVVYGGSNYFSSSSSNCNLNINLTPDFSYAISISADSKRFIQVDNLNKVYSFNKWVSGSSSINIVTGQYYFMSLDSCDSSPEIFSSISSINKSGVLLYGSGNSFNLVYYDIAPLSVNQFSAVYDRGGELGFERVIFVLNGVKKVSLSFSVNLWSKILGPEEITTKFSENGVEVLNKKEIITYGYSTYSKSNGFDMVQSFAIVKSEVNDAVIRAWLNCEGLYPEGGMKAAYGTFMTSLTTMWLNDMLANQESKYLGVKWVRNDYLTVFTGIMHEGKVYVHCPDASMKMLVDGFNDKVINFRFICSVMLSELEETALAISEASIKFSNSGVIAAIGNHSNFTVNKNGNIIVLTADGVNNSKFIIDTDTGIVKDLLSLDSFEYKGSISDLGSFCFHSYLTDNLKSSLLKSLGLKTINFSNVVDGFIDYVTTYWRSGLMLGANIIGFPATFAKAITISGLSSFVPICGMLLCEGDIILALRDCLPDNLWNYIGLHRNIIQTKTIPIMKSPSSYDYIEVEYNNKGQLDRSTAIYIDGYNGKRDMTVEETYNYF